MVLRTGPYSRFWGCTRFPECRGTHSAHADGTPHGTPADGPTKQWRIKAHESFDQLWKDRKGRRAVMRRGQAYVWMREAMGLSEEDAHISRMNSEQCQKLIRLVDAYLR